MKAEPIPEDKRIAKAQAQTFIQKLTRMFGELLERTHGLYDVHTALAHIWLSEKKGAESTFDELAFFAEALPSTWKFACLEPESAVEAVGLQLLLCDHPEISEKVPELNSRLQTLFEPFFEDARSGLLPAVYLRQNHVIGRLVRRDLEAIETPMREDEAQSDLQD